MKSYIAALACALIYFAAAFLTLSDYGMKRYILEEAKHTFIIF